LLADRAEARFDGKFSPDRFVVIRIFRRFLVLLLPVLLLSAQMAAFAHAASHFHHHHPDEDSSSHYCAECLSFSPLSTPAPTTAKAPTLATIEGADGIEAILPVSIEASFTPAYFSRAPPVAV